MTGKSYAILRVDLRQFWTQSCLVHVFCGADSSLFLGRPSSVATAAVAKCSDPLSPPSYSMLPAYDAMS